MNPSESTIAAITVSLTVDENMRLVKVASRLRKTQSIRCIGMIKGSEGSIPEVDCSSANWAAISVIDSLDRERSISSTRYIGFSGRMDSLFDL